MKPILTRLFTGFFIFLAAQAFGQVFTTSFVVVQPASSPYPIGSQIVVELRVTNFTNIESMQFPITYNKDVLKYDSIGSVVFDNWIAAANSVSYPTQGRVGISWQADLGANPTGVTVSNNTAIFKLYFTGLANGSAQLNISTSPGSAPPIPVEISRQGSGPLPPNQINVTSGGVNVPVGTGVPAYMGFKIIANPIYIPQGERGCMPVTVNDFDGIQSMQFAMHWDNTVLNYECTRRYNLPGWSSVDFGSPSPGTLLVGWSDPAGVGITRADGVRIYDVCFKAVGASGATTNVTIDGTGFPQGNGTAEAINNLNPPADVWSNGGANGASGVSAASNIIVTPAASSFVTYTADIVTTPPGTMACVGVKVKNFANITDAEFALSYKPSELAYQSIDFGSNPLNLVATNVTHPTLPNPAPAVHHVKFLWSNANGVTLADNSNIFSACFNVIAPVGTESPLTLTTTACPQVTGMGTGKSIGGVPIATVNGMVRAQSSLPAPVVTNLACNGVNTGKIELNITSGPTPTGYSWVGPNSYVGSGATISNLAPGTYTVTVTFTGGSTATTTAAVTAPPAMSATNTVNTPSCFGNTNAAINLSPAGGVSPYTFSWASGQTSEDLSGIGAGTYTVTIKDQNNCTFSSTITVNGPAQMALTPANITVTHPTCASSANGAISINPTGGNTPYSSYLWSNNANTKNISNLAAGSYTVTVTDANGCTAVLPAPNMGITITAPSAMTAGMAGKGDIKCLNTNSGFINITVLGGAAGNKSYCWYNTPTPPNPPTGGNCISTQQNPTNLAAGIYNVVITDAAGCTATLMQPVTITPPSSAMTVASSATPSPCFDTPSGSITVTPSGGWGAYNYSWTGGLSGPSPINVPPGNYTVTVTDGGGCSSTQAINVAGSPAILAAQEVQHVTCFGQNNGGIDLNLSGGNQPWQSITWINTSLTGEAIGNLAPGIYTATVKDNAGCTKTFPPIEITGPAELQVGTTITETDPVNGTGAIDLEITQGGTPGFEYSWTGPDGFTATTQDISGAGVVAGEYTVVIKDANACERTFNFSVPSGNVLLGNPGVQVQFKKDACNNDGCIRLTIPASAANAGPFTVNWGGTAQPTSSNTLSVENCNLAPGLYAPTVTADNGNSVVLPVIEIVQLELATVTIQSNEPFDEMSNGQINLISQVSNPLLYDWSPINSSSNLVNGLDSGLYVVTITNSVTGCSTVRSIHLDRQYYDLVVSTDAVANPNCATVPTGSINLKVVGGNSPYEFSWVGPNGFTASTEDLNGLAPGFYAVTITDENSTTQTQSFTLTAQSNLAITNVNELSNHNGYQVSGAEICDGVAVVAFIPGFGTNTVIWSNGVTGVSNNTLCGGAYSVTVFDGLGCSSVWNNELTAPAPLKVEEEDVATVTCNGDCNATGKVILTGGVEPYKVEWSTGQVDPAIFDGDFSQAVNLCAGNYVVTVTDQNDVKKIYVVKVLEPTPIEITFAPTPPRNFNSCDGDLLAEVSGATLPVNFVWSGSFGHTGNGERAEGLCSGEYVEFIVIDANGCSAFASDSVPYPADGCFRVSPIITPGEQDGKNDNVHITCIETAPDNTMEIYNRWGQLVFKTEGYTNDDSDREHNWDGRTDAGAALPEGVYYYVLNLTIVDDATGQKREEQFKGAINLLR